MKKEYFLKFLGTAGARFVMIRQLRSSAGIWLRSCDTNILIDPGPGSIVQCNKPGVGVDPSILDAIILTHRHLDHCGDVNVMIEAMTEGGTKKRGLVFCPRQALSQDPVIFKHVHQFVQRIQILKEKVRYNIKDVSFQASMRHIHPTETYGLKFLVNNKKISFISDTKYFLGLEEFYSCDILVLFIVFCQPRPHIAHLSINDAEQIIASIKPKKAILTHFGMSMLKAEPDLLAKKMGKRLGIDVVAAYDCMKVQI